jgi:hypothetical protein
MLRLHITHKIDAKQTPQTLRLCTCIVVDDTALAVNRLILPADGFAGALAGGFGFAGGPGFAAF